MKLLKKTEKSREKAAARFMEKPRGEWKEIDLKSKLHPNWMTRAFSNNRYVVMVQDNCPTTNGDAIKAFIQRHDDKPIPNHWAEMQRIKNELFGAESIGIEYYPAQSELVNHHNIYWLFILDKNQLPIPIK
jgi:hypothetical protein